MQENYLYYSQTAFPLTVLQSGFGHTWWYALDFHRSVPPQFDSLCTVIEFINTWKLVCVLSAFVNVCAYSCGGKMSFFTACLSPELLS